MSRAASYVLRIPLALLFLLGLLVQVLFLPLAATALAHDHPELDWLVIPYVIIGVVTVLCGQVVVVAIWALLGMAEGDQIFRQPALRWVNLIIGSGAVATVCVLAIALHLFLVVGQGAPPVAAYGLVVLITAGMGFVLLMVVMRGLLAAATTMRGELDGLV